MFDFKVPYVSLPLEHNGFNYLFLALIAAIALYKVSATNGDCTCHSLWMSNTDVWPRCTALNVDGYREDPRAPGNSRSASHSWAPVQPGGRPCHHLREMVEKI